jgi:hypothetical protein
MSKDIIANLSSALIAAGYQVWLSKSAEYGFFTTTGKAVASFNYRLGGIYYGGCYRWTSNPRYTGTGWTIDKDSCAEGREYWDNILQAAAHPPRWAIGSHDYKLASANDLVKLWPASQYTKVNKGESDERTTD